MDQEFRALGIAAGQVQTAAMAADKFGGNGKAKSGAAFARAALKGLEKVFAGLGRQAGAGVADPDSPVINRLGGRNLDGACTRLVFYTTFLSFIRCIRDATSTAYS